MTTAYYDAMSGYSFFISPDTTAFPNKRQKVFRLSCFKRVPDVYLNKYVSMRPIFLMFDEETMVASRGLKVSPCAATRSRGWYIVSVGGPSKPPPDQRNITRWMLISCKKDLLLTESTLILIRKIKVWSFQLISLGFRYISKYTGCSNKDWLILTIKYF